MYGMVVLFLQLGCACFVYVVILIQYNGVHFNVFKFVFWCPSAAQRNKLRSSFEVGADVLILWRRTLQEVQSAVCETLHEKLPDACSQIQIRENRLTGCYAFIFYIEGCRNVNCLKKKTHQETQNVSGDVAFRRNVGGEMVPRRNVVWELFL